MACLRPSTLRARFARPNRLRRFVEPLCLFRGFESLHFLKLAEREGLMACLRPSTLRARFARPNRLRRFVEPHCLFRGFESLHFLKLAEREGFEPSKGF